MVTKNMMKTLELLVENMTTTVYHSSDLESTARMLEQNVFKLRPVKISGLKHNPVNADTYKYYMSTARTMTSVYMKGNVLAALELIIEFDGEKLSQNFKGKAVDWYSGKDERVYGKHQDEAEDRLYSKYPNVSNIKKYIRAIHILRETTEGMEKHYFTDIVQSKRNFPIYVYENKRDMKFLVRSRAEKL